VPARHLPAIAMCAGIVATRRAWRWQAGLPAIAMCAGIVATRRAWRLAGGWQAGIQSR